ncbi:MAG: single-stranded DNA-binding protein [Chloroflexaceae bacterium]|jgi:single-strand DNA-binding protein|nr:single-stranded DNA-binding protein [Chloroflexaceae bacterium]
MKHVKGTINRVEMLGWLGGTPELRTTPGGSQVCRFNVATKRVAGREATGAPTYDTDWTIVEAWDRLAERCGHYLQKGSRVLVVGSLRTDTWVDKESGQQRYKTYVRAADVLFLDSRGEQREQSEELEEEGEEVPF